MKTEKQRQAAAEMMRARWQDPEWREKVKAAQRAGKHHYGPDHPRYSGGHKTKHGYVLVYVLGVKMQRSHVVWNEAHPDDPILPGEVIHHKNRVRDDDRPENLEKLTSSEHTALHHKGVAWTPEHRQNALAASRSVPKQHSVKSCGKAHSYCMVCAPERYGPEWREKVRRGQQARGWTINEEQRAKLSAATTAYHARRKAEREQG